MKGTDRQQLPQSGRDKQRDRRLVGEVVAGKYKVLNVLGQGGFGTVFLVEMTTGIVGDRLAMKILPREFSHNDVFREQFLNEIRVAMKMVDKQIVQIRDVGVLDDVTGENEGLLYYTMDYVEGRSLAQILAQDGPLTVPRALRIVRRILPALRTAHNAGIIHRDLKPANVMVETDESGNDQVRVLDFGIATAIDAEANSAPPEPEPIVTGKPGPREKRKLAGSPHYMPPEQFKSREMGFYTDLYSVGVILYECITGRRPYEGRSPQEIYNAMRSGPPARIDELAPDVHAYPGLSDLVMKALERNPQKRFQTAKEFYEDLVPVISGTGTGAGTTTTGASAPSPGGGARPAGKAGGFRGRGPRRAASSRGPTSPNRDVPRTGTRQEPGRRSYARLVVISTLVLAGLGLLLLGGGTSTETDAPLEDATSSQNPVVPPEPTDTGLASPDGKDSGSTEAPPDPQTSGESADDVTVAERIRQGEQRVRKKIQELAKEGLAAVRGKDLATAAERADEILQLRQRHVQGLLLGGIVLVEQQKYIEARPLLEQVIDTSSKDKKTRLLASVYLGEVYMRLPKAEWNDARVYLESALRADEKNVRTLTLLAELYETHGNSDALHALVRRAHELGVENDRLVSLWEEIFVAGPKRVRAAAQKNAAGAKTAFAKRDWAGAAKLATKTLDAVPSLEIAEMAIAANVRLERPEGIAHALNALRKILEADPDAASDHRSSGRLAYHDGRLAYFRHLETGSSETRIAAETHLGKTIELADPTKQPELFCGAHTYLGILRALDGELSPVVARFAPTLRIKAPEHMFEQARTYMTLARKTPEKKVKLKAYGLARARLLDLSKLDGLQKLLAAKTEYRLGQCCLRIGILSNGDHELKAARKHLRRATRDEQVDTAEVHDLLAQTYIHDESWIRAAQSYRDAYNREPTPGRCLEAVELFIRSNSRTSARELLERAIENHPKNGELRAKLLELDGQ